MRNLILGTAGHIDHGKTALVRALTGVDTDRLKEEKERGITVDLGFAELEAPGGIRFGVVDVPGHEGFIRNMLAGATGMDLVLLVVAADEGFMPQTREHLAIVQLLGVPQIAVALAKSDLVDDEWLEMVAEEVAETLRGTPYAPAPIIPVSSVTEVGLERLREVLSELGASAALKQEEDLSRLPVDRVFTIRGAGTVVTGTLWTGGLRVGDRVRILPGEREARVKSLQLHGKEVDTAPAGSRVAVGLTGSGITHQSISRGQVLVTDRGWAESRMLDCRLQVLPETGWEVVQGQRVRVHLGTAEVLARVAILEGDSIPPGGVGWVQLRLEEPVLGRALDRFVVRSYSPVTTIAGGRIAEPFPAKRRRLLDGEGDRLAARLDPEPEAALVALLDAAGWVGANQATLPQRLGYSPETTVSVANKLTEAEECWNVEGTLFGRSTWALGRSMMVDRLSSFHATEPLKPGLPIEELRQALPGQSGPGLSEGIMRALVAEGALEPRGGLVALAHYVPELDTRQLALQETIRATLGSARLSVPGLRELAETVGGRAEEVEAILKLMEAQGEVLGLEGSLFFLREAVETAGSELVETLGGKRDLGPADFREVLGVSRKFLLPILRYLDTVGVTTRLGESRSVEVSVPEGWGTSGKGKHSKQ